MKINLFQRASDVQKTMGLIERVSPTPDDICEIDYINGDEPALVAIGGDGTASTTNANYYAGRLKTTLSYGHVNNVKVYAPYFDIMPGDSGALRRFAFKRAGRKLERNYDVYKGIKPTRNHLLFIYDKIIRPRVFTNDGLRFDTNIAIERVRKLKLFGHCHGATIIQELAYVMSEKMSAGGYTVDEIKQIQSQLLVIQYAPIAPLDNSIFPTISFASSTDELMVNHANYFAKYIWRNSFSLPPAFFAEPHGNVFIGPLLKFNPDLEHDLDYIWETWNPLQRIFTENGMIIYSAMRNALVRAAQHSVNGGELPDVKALTDRLGVNFDQLRQNGDKIYADMVTNLRQLKKHHK